MRRMDIEGHEFPAIETVTLSGRSFIAPDPSRGREMLLFIAFKRDVQEQVDAWGREIDPILEEFHNVEAFELPMLAGRWKFLSGVIDGGMRSGIPEGQHDYVATFYGDIKTFKRSLEIRDEDVCYVVLIDTDGIIRFAAQGPPNRSLITELETVLRQ